MGDGAVAEKMYGSAYGYNSKAQGTFSTAIGSETHAEGDRSTAVGNTAFSTGNDSVAIGSYVNSDNNGINAVPSGDRSVAIGFRTQSTGQSSVAIGDAAKVNVSSGVALGRGSQASRGAGVQGYVPEGANLSSEQKNSATWKSTSGEVSVGSDGNTRQITHVAAGTQDTDAVNVAQLKAVNERINAGVNADLQQMENRFSGRLESMQQSFDSRINDVEKEAQAGIAMAIATAGLPQAYLPGKSMFSMATGVFRGESGYAMSISHVTDSGDWVFKATGSGNSQGHFGGSIGAGYQW